jgi:hypothetical protein
MYICWTLSLPRWDVSQSASQPGCNGEWRVSRHELQCLRISYVMQSRTTTVICSYLKTSVYVLYYSRCSNLGPSWVKHGRKRHHRLSYFLHHLMPCSMPSFLNVTVFHCNVSKRVVYNQISNWLLVGLCTAYIAVALYFHIKRLKKTNTRDCNRLWGTAKHNMKALNIHSVLLIWWRFVFPESNEVPDCWETTRYN